MTRLSAAGSKMTPETITKANDIQSKDHKVHHLLPNHHDPGGHKTSISTSQKQFLSRYVLVINFYYGFIIVSNVLSVKCNLFQLSCCKA